MAVRAEGFSEDPIQGNTKEEVYQQLVDLYPWLKFIAKDTVLGWIKEANDQP